MSKVRLNILGTQSHLDDDVSTEMTVIGELERVEDRYILKIAEDMDSETIISVTPYGAVEIVREGAEASESYQMVFERDKAFSTNYQTPVGQMDTLIFPTLVEADMKEDAGRIDLEYVVGIMGHQIINQRSFTYTAEPQLAADSENNL
ncbi:MAG: DUF1934 domain-containing protein [Christensenellaceae bacterium]|nr:DUF1934 domain-containing protein [Christensenellaceae bacterium]